MSGAQWRIQCLLLLVLLELLLGRNMLVGKLLVEKVQVWPSVESHIRGKKWGGHTQQPKAHGSLGRGGDGGSTWRLGCRIRWRHDGLIKVHRRRVVKIKVGEGTVLAMLK